MFKAQGLLSIAALLALASCSSTPSLFNGKNLDGWHADVMAADQNPDIEPSFGIERGMLVSYGEPEGHLITDEIYRDYRLTVEYRFPGEPGNCGVLVHASTPRYLYDQFPKSIECQMHHQNAGDFWCIGENITVDNMAERRKGDPSTWGGEQGQSRQIKNVTDDSEMPLGEWNTMVIECKGSTIDVWVNGDHVNHGYDCTVSEGQIALQAEKARVEVRRFDIEDLGA